jgi:hypothetical protein
MTQLGRIVGRVGMADLRDGRVRARMAALGVVIAAADCGECVEGASCCQNNTVELCTITTERGPTDRLAHRERVPQFDLCGAPGPVAPVRHIRRPDPSAGDRHELLRRQPHHRLHRWVRRYQEHLRC